MIKTSKQKPLFILSTFTAVIAFAVAGFSLLDNTVYNPSTPTELLPGAAAQDTITLIASICILLCIQLIKRGRERTWLVWAGLLMYLFYAYALYSFDRVYNQLFLCYVMILGSSVYSVIVFLLSLNTRRLSVKKNHSFPEKPVAALLILLSLMFICLWLSILIPAMTNRIPPEGNSIFVLDLSFFIPLMVAESVFLLRKKKYGIVLAIPLLVKLTTLGISVLTGELYAPLFGLRTDPSSVIVYALLGIGPLVFIFPAIKSLSVNNEG